MKALVLALALVGMGTAAKAKEFVAYPHFGSVSLVEFCDNGKGYFVTKNPVQVCDLKQTQWAHSQGETSVGNEFVNTNCRMQKVSVKRDYMGKEIVKWDMGEASSEPVTKDVVKTLPLSWKVEVQEYKGGQLAIRYVSYTVPSCGK